MRIYLSRDDVRGYWPSTMSKFGADPERRDIRRSQTWIVALKLLPYSREEKWNDAVVPDLICQCQVPD